MNKITFGDLSWPLKTAVVTSWIIGALYLIAILVGFIGWSLIQLDALVMYGIVGAIILLGIIVFIIGLLEL